MIYSLTIRFPIGTVGTKPVFDGSMREFHMEAHEYFKSLVLDPEFACIAGQSATRSGKYAFCAYPNMEDLSAAEGICHDLVTYNKTFDIPSIPAHKGVKFVSFIAAFAGSNIHNQMDGVRSLYTLLYNMHQINKKYFAWTKGVENDMDDNDFGFSIGGEAYFVPFLYKYSGSKSRYSEIPFVLFNTHHTFAKLRSLGIYDELKFRIRKRQSRVHPMLGDHGAVPEFPQYSLVDNTPESIAMEKRIRDEIIGPHGFD